MNTLAACPFFLLLILVLTLGSCDWAHVIAFWLMAIVTRLFELPNLLSKDDFIMSVCYFSFFYACLGFRFSSLPRSASVLGPNQLLIQTVPWALFARVERPKCVFSHPLSCIPEVKNQGFYIRSSTHGVILNVTLAWLLPCQKNELYGIDVSRFPLNVRCTVKVACCCDCESILNKWKLCNGTRWNAVTSLALC